MGRARQSVQSAIDAAKLLGGEVWVRAGTVPGAHRSPRVCLSLRRLCREETARAQRKSLLTPPFSTAAAVIKVVQCGNAGFLVSALDGFTIRNGGKYTAGGGLSQYGVGGLGGGIYVGVASPYIANNLITHNSLAHDNRPSFPQPASYGAGIYCELSYAMIIGNTIRENEILNTFDGSGGGIYCTHSMPSIEQNRIASNHAKYGAAIYAVDSSLRVRNNVIESNAMYNTYPLPLYLGSASGAIDLHDGSDFLIEANTIAGNTAAVGAGVSVSGFGSGRLQNNLILNNRAYEATGIGGMGGGIYCLVMTNAVDPVLILNNTLLGNSATSPFGEQGGALAFSLPPPADKLVIANNLIVSNSSGIFQTLTTPMSRASVLNNNLLNVRNDYINLPAGGTDIRRAPVFCDLSAGNYRLQTNSPGIDAGTTRYAPSVDMDGLPRSLDGDGDGVAVPDLGAFETILPTADSDHDGMPDGWEVENFLEPAVDDAALDRDGDGMCNVDEHVAGTGPSEGASVFKLTASVFEATGDFLLRWPSVVGRLYRIESASGLPAASGWQVVQENMVGTGGALEFHGAKPDSPTRLYRVEVQPALW